MDKGSLWETIDHWMENSEFLATVERKINLSRKATVLICVLTFVYILSLQAGRDLIVNIIAFVLPIYQSYKALKTNDPVTHKRCLSYWVVYGSYTLIESLLWRLALIIPFYRFLKCGFLFYCFLPSTNGAEQVLDQILGPMLTPYESTIDPNIEPLMSFSPSQMSSRMPTFPRFQMPEMRNSDGQPMFPYPDFPQFPFGTNWRQQFPEFPSWQQFTAFPQNQPSHRPTDFSSFENNSSAAFNSVSNRNSDRNSDQSVSSTSDASQQRIEDVKVGDDSPVVEAPESRNEKDDCKGRVDQQSRRDDA